VPRLNITNSNSELIWSVSVLLHLVNLLKPTGYGMHQQVEYFNNCTLCPHCIYVFCVCLRTNSDLRRLHKKKLIGFITQMKSVYSAVRAGSLNEAVCAPFLKVKDFDYENINLLKFKSPLCMTSTPTIFVKT
jgi:hypothetical protein